MDFARKLIGWQRRHGRHGLPWQGTRDPYRIWLSEVMLQQTQVGTVVPYYLRFLERYPSVEALSAASEDEVLALWSGLGYYARGRNLHKAARQIALHDFPKNSTEMQSLPGIGRSTAAAIAVFAYGERAAILDGNAKRVLARCYGVQGWPGQRDVEQRLWRLSERLLPAKGVRAYTQALMDVGATLCTKRRPVCGECPVSAMCIARKQRRVGQIPAPRPRKALPLKSATWLVLRHAGRVLLERRPANGVWGGLWSFPELDEGRDAREHCLRRLGCRVAAFSELHAIQHGFTHFRLRIRPLLGEAVPGVAVCDAPGPRWWNPRAAAEGAVPAPVRRLLQGMAGSS